MAADLLEAYRFSADFGHFWPDFAAYVERIRGLGVSIGEGGSASEKQGFGGSEAGLEAEVC